MYNANKVKYGLQFLCLLWQQFEACAQFQKKQTNIVKTVVQKKTEKKNYGQDRFFKGLTKSVSKYNVTDEYNYSLKKNSTCIILLLSAIKY